MRPPAFGDVVRALLSTGVPVSFRATGSSMTPTIRDGEIVTVLPLAMAEPRKGCVVLYDDGIALRAHRVRRVAGETYVVRGDAPGLVDETVERARLHGVLVSIHRSGLSVEPRASIRSKIVGVRARARRALKAVLGTVGGVPLVRSPSGRSSRGEEWRP